MTAELQRVGLARDRLDDLEARQADPTMIAAALADVEAAYAALEGSLRSRPPWPGFARVPAPKRRFGERVGPYGR